MVLSITQQKQRNAILEQLYLKGPLSRSELSRLLKIIPATITEIVAYLIKQGIVEEIDLGERASRKKKMLQVVPHVNYYVGIELSESDIIFGLTDNLGNVIATKTEKIIPLKEYVYFHVPWLVQQIKDFLEQHQDYQVSALGLAIPGHYDEENQKIISNNPFWSSLNLSDILSQFDMPIYVKNNVKCMALNQLYFEKEKELGNFLFVNFQRGMFATYVYEHKIYADNNFGVGEFGHVVVNPNGERCECGKIGCLQTYASVTWILKKAKYIFKYVPRSYLRNIVHSGDEIQLKHVIAAYHMGDETIVYLINQAIEYIALQINNALVLLDAEHVYIHGKLFEDTTILKLLQTKINDVPALIQSEREIIREVKNYQIERGALGACALAMLHDFIYHNQAD